MKKIAQFATAAALLLLPALAFAQTGSPVNIRDSSTGNQAQVTGNSLHVAIVNADATGTPTALNNTNVAASVGAAGYQGCGMFLAAGTLAATLTPEVSYDGGTTWLASQFYDPSTQALSATKAFTNPNAATQFTVMMAGGVSTCRVRVSAFTSGAATATMRATTNPAGATTIQGTVAVSGSVTVTGTVAVSSITTSVTPGTGAANLGKAEDSAASDGDVGVYALSVRQDTPASSTTTDGDYQSIKSDSIGRLWVHIAASDNTQTVSGTVTANAGTGTFLTNPVGFSSGLVTGQTTATNSATALATNTVHSACVAADYNNLVVMYAGATGITSGTGLPLYAGQQQCWSVTNTNQLFILAPSGSPVADWTGI